MIYFNRLKIICLESEDIFTVVVHRNYLFRKNKKRKLVNVQENEFAWQGCGENIEYGIKKSKDFLDTRYKKRSDMKTLVKLHNYVAGRLVSIHFLGQTRFYQITRFAYLPI